MNAAFDWGPGEGEPDGAIIMNRMDTTAPETIETS